MDEGQFVWEHFKLNAEQRLKSFNFFVLLSMFADGGVFAALEKGFAPSVVVLLGLAIMLFGILFGIVDARSRNLIELTIPAFRQIEHKFQEQCRLFTLEAAKPKTWVRYRVAFTSLICAQLAFGLGIVIWSVHAMCQAG